MPRSDLPETRSVDVDQLGATQAAAAPHPLPRATHVDEACP